MRIAMPNLFLPVIMFLLSACDRHVTISSAEINRVNNNVNVVAYVHSIDANNIRIREIYAGFLLTECGDAKNRYPFDALIDGLRSPKYQIQKDGVKVAFKGTVPVRIYRQFSSPCIALEGGSYLSEKISTNRVSLPSLLNVY